MDQGYFLVEVRELTLCYSSKQETAALVRLDIEINNGLDVIKWSQDGSSIFKSSTFTPELQEQPVSESVENKEATAEEEKHPAEDAPPPVEEEVYFVGFNDLTLKSSFLDLNNDVMNGLSNAELNLKVVKPTGDGDAAAAAPAKGKGAPASDPVEDEVVFQLSLPLSSLLAMNSGKLEVQETLEELSSEDSVLKTTIPNSAIIPSKSSLVYTVMSDNDLAAYCLGSKVVFWNNAIVKAPPPTWGFDSPDVQDPKAKVPPTPEEFREKYLANIPLLVEGQDKVCTFSLSVGGTSGTGEDETKEEDVEKEDNPIQDFFPILELGGGLVSYDSETAATVPVEEDIRARGDLWTISWGSSPALFIHRSLVRKLVALIKKDPSAAMVPLSMKRTAAAEVTDPAPPLLATAVLDVAALVTAGCSTTTLSAGFVGADIGEGVNIAVGYAVNTALVPKAVKVNKLSSTDSVGKVAPSAQISSTEPNRDIMKEMRDEIKLTIERIAQEYVGMFPSTSEVPSSSSGVPIETEQPRTGGKSEGVAKESPEQRKNEFLMYLSSQGIFHELKEKLRLKVELLVRDRYGSRGRALGKSPTMASIDVGYSTGVEPEAPSSEETADTLLSEMYVFLLRECSTVLNAMFSNTMVDRDKADLSKNAFINDEERTDQQEFSQLLARAHDAMADNRFAAAEALHLERIQLVNHSLILGSQSSAVHDVYARFGEFLLTQLAAERSLDGGSNTTNVLLNRAREALALAFNVYQMNWEVGLLYACVLIELDQQEQSEVVLNRVIEVQLTGSGDEYTMQTFVAFDGYDTDKLCPINPKCYAVLAALFSMQDLPLKSRKALSLANRSFAEGGYSPPVSTHGSPRRTLVLCLSETSLYLFQFAMTKLAQECVKLAIESEAAVTAKATARGKPATTVPYIKHFLLRATSQSLMSPGCSLPQAGSNRAESLDMAVSSELVVEAAVDKVQGWIAVATAQQFCDTPVSEVIESYLNIVQVASTIPVENLKGQQIVPLKSFVQGAKLLIGIGRFDEAVSMLLFACSVYISSTLFSLLGVALMRMDRLAEAEDALVEANLLDYRNPEVWAYLSLLCLTSGPFRMEESTKCLFQALRLGLNSSSLLRELATANMAADKLQTAEDLVRRAIRSENRQNPRTRRLLADILASQNQALGAIEEYQGIISDDSADKRSKLEAAEKCADLLSSLGRDEELKTLSDIIHTINQESGE